MTDIKLLNNPEYRWYHKEEMSKTMPYQSERTRLGIKVLRYDILRGSYLKTIKENTFHKLNWNRFEWLIDIVPEDLNREYEKTHLQPADMFHFEKRDGCKCFLCETVSRYNTQLHHIIPNGDTSDNNIVTLCIICHKMVHAALCASGKWKCPG